MKQKHTLWRVKPLLCTIAILVLPVTESYAQRAKHKKPQSGMQTQAPAVKSKVTLTDKQRDAVRASVRKNKPATTGSAGAVEKDVTIGERLPSNVVVERFSDNVYRSVPPVRSYHYIARDRGIYLVDPRRRVVVDLIE